MQLRIRIVTGQFVTIDNVQDWSVDALGLRATQKEKDKEPVKIWHNTAALISVTEEN